MRYQLFITGCPKLLLKMLKSLSIFSTFCVKAGMLLVRRDEDTWYRALSVDEYVKTSSWRFMMRCEPYVDALDVRVVKSNFRTRLKSILSEHKDLAEHLGGSVSEQVQITDKMCEV